MVKLHEVLVQLLVHVYVSLRIHMLSGKWLSYDFVVGNIMNIVNMHIPCKATQGNHLRLLNIMNLADFTEIYPEPIHSHIRRVFQSDQLSPGCLVDSGTK